MTPHLNSNEPADYIIGHIPFLNAKIDLSLRPLIPRTETEYWTEQAITDLKKVKRPIKCLDLFAGSGAIGIAILKNIRNASVDFGDIDKKCLKQIQINIKTNDLLGRQPRLIKTDVFSNIKNKYDYIFANPPYIPEKRKSKLDYSVLGYEPHHALFGGKDGLEYLKEFLKDAEKYTMRGGRIYFEFDHPQQTALTRYLKSLNYEFDLFKDQFGYWRWGIVKFE